MRKHKNLLTADEIKRKNWIYELEAMGITSGPNNEPLQELGYYAIRDLMVLEKIRRED
ncbi:hypothetical protein [Planococcus sp. YIM B11945]|uniref:hypothetical protein n=1 Tax=Planococcus sp. YIM B11945 TaxID=3435410 RepID=UPI003D7C8880